MARPYPGIAPGGYSIHYTNTIPNPYPGANPGYALNSLFAINIAQTLPIGCEGFTSLKHMFVTVL